MREGRSGAAVSLFLCSIQLGCLGPSIRKLDDPRARRARRARLKFAEVSRTIVERYRKARKKLAAREKGEDSESLSRKLAAFVRPRTVEAMRNAVRAGVYQGTLDFLIEAEDKDGLRTVERMLKSPNESKRRAALCALDRSARLGRSQRAIQVLLENLARAEHPRREELAAALAKINLFIPVRGMLTCLSDSVPAIRATAARALGEHPTGEAVAALLSTAQRDQEPSVRAAALAGLAQARAAMELSEEQLKQVLGLLRSDASPLVRVKVLRYFWEEKKLPREVLDLLSAHDARVREEALFLLSARRAPDAAPALTQLLHSLPPGHKLRARAADALSASGEQAAEQPLIEALTDRSPENRTRAIRALEALWTGHRLTGTEPLRGDRRPTVDALVRMLKDVDERVRLQAARALADLKAEGAVPHLVAACRAATGRHRTALLKMLAGVKSSRARGYFERLYEKSQPLEVRSIAGDALTELGESVPGHARVRKAARWEAFRKGGQLVRSSATTASFAPAPLLVFGRTGLASPLQLTGPGGFGIAQVSRRGTPDVILRFGYAPLTEEGRRREATSFRVDWGAGLTRGYHAPGRAEHRRVYTSWAHGPSALFLDMEGDDRDMVGLGWFGRASVQFLVRSGWTLGLYADAHVWGGADRKGPQAAGSAALGVDVARSF